MPKYGHYICMIGSNLAQIWSWYSDNMVYPCVVFCGWDNMWTAPYVNLQCRVCPSAILSGRILERKVWSKKIKLVCFSPMKAAGIEVRKSFWLLQTNISMRPAKNYLLQIFECFKQSKSDEIFSPDWNPMLRVLHFSDQILQLKINEHQNEIYVIHIYRCMQVKCFLVRFPKTHFQVGQRTWCLTIPCWTLLF